MYFFRFPGAVFSANTLGHINHWKHCGISVHCGLLITLVLFSCSLLPRVILPFLILSLPFPHLYHPSFHSIHGHLKFLSNFDLSFLGELSRYILPSLFHWCKSKSQKECLKQQSEVPKKYLGSRWTIEGE